MRFKQERGSMTVEAALFLVAFLAAFLTIINFGRLAKVQIVMQHALNNTAMQISQYGYILTRTGMADEINKTSEDAKKFKSDADTVATSVMELSDAIGSVAGNAANGNISIDDIEDLIGAVNGSQDAINIGKEYFKNPKGLLTGLLAVGKDEIGNQVRTLIVSRIAESQIESYIEKLSSDPDKYLENLGIVEGLEGLDFSKSTLLADGSKDVNIVIKFKVSNKMFPMFDFGEHDMYLSASTRIW